jgi:hypothetical protein
MAVRTLGSRRSRLSAHRITDSDIEATLAVAERRGLMAGHQYRHIVARLLAEPGSLLVFGLGHDSALWWRCVEERAAFVEDDPRFVAMAPALATVLLYDFPSRTGVWCEVPEIPPLIDRAWDYVLVDGPRGYNQSCPGRQIPIAWASRLARRSIFVHDSQRRWESDVCRKVLGSPTKQLKDTTGRRGELAIFDVPTN